ncbi:unnamed protein product [Leptidea sinapis]|uniref:Uncharacterized protein n=1 Tax=Leptidea sinapis TaxID=189913 RepID=A0A5E4PQB2_9NEOP|nr:unnamed protein product [Leptidea sinapis]
MQGSNDTLSVGPHSSGSPAVLLTPGRTRNIAQDMEALRLSRQDNPYLQQVMASRESLIESQREECESDDTILMSQEFGSTALDYDDDPLTLKEVHEHMIRSPPPTNCWPHGESHLRSALNKKQTNQQTEKFSLLQHPKPLRRAHIHRRSEDSIQLVQDFTK